jgi:hypothetical protein
MYLEGPKTDFENKGLVINSIDWTVSLNFVF